VSAKVDDLWGPRYPHGRGARQFRIRLLESVFDEKVQIVALIEHLALDVWIVLLELTDFSVLLRNELLAHRRDLDVDVILREIEVRSEIPGRLAAVVPFEGKRMRLVLPVDRVEVKEPRKFALAVVSELRRVGL
jgi:hypothetical protein